VRETGLIFRVSISRRCATGGFTYRVSPAWCPISFNSQAGQRLCHNAGSRFQD